MQSTYNAMQERIECLKKTQKHALKLAHEEKAAIRELNTRIAHHECLARGLDAQANMALDQIRELSKRVRSSEDTDAAGPSRKRRKTKRSSTQGKPTTLKDVIMDSKRRDDVEDDRKEDRKEDEDEDEDKDEEEDQKEDEERGSDEDEDEKEDEEEPEHDRTDGRATGPKNPARDETKHCRELKDQEVSGQESSYDASEEDASAQCSKSELAAGSATDSNSEYEVDDIGDIIKNHNGNLKLLRNLLGKHGSEAVDNIRGVPPLIMYMKKVRRGENHYYNGLGIILKTIKIMGFEDNLGYYTRSRSKATKCTHELFLGRPYEPTALGYAYLNDKVDELRFMLRILNLEKVHPSNLIKDVKMIHAFVAERKEGTEIRKVLTEAMKISCRDIMKEAKEIFTEEAKETSEMI